MTNVASNLVILLAPFAPHLSEEKWEYLGNGGSVHDKPWPDFDPAALAKDEVEIVVQLNGKVKDRMKIGANASSDELKSAALELPKIKNSVASGQIVDVIVVPGRLVNIVLK
jgi:leucyl-tRNA synthetase